MVLLGRVTCEWVYGRSGGKNPHILIIAIAPSWLFPIFPDFSSKTNRSRHTNPTRVPLAPFELCRPCPETPVSDMSKGLENLGVSIRLLGLTYNLIWPSNREQGRNTHSLGRPVHVVLAHRRQVERRQERVQFRTWLSVYRAWLYWQVESRLLSGI